MGNCGSTEQAVTSEKSGGNGYAEDDRSRSRALDRELREYEKMLSTQVKILLLGAGESGKTTVLKVSESPRRLIPFSTTVVAVRG
jgi:hypothetical protein